MGWLIAAAIPLAGVLGGLVGAWWSKRAADRATIGALLGTQFEALWSDEPRRRAAAVDTIRQLIKDGDLNEQQLMAASYQLRHWAAVNWQLSAEERRSLET